MQRFNSYYSLNVFALELDKWDFPEHNHNFYEIIFVEKGTGDHILNDARISYEAGDVFILRPEDGHYFEIKESTKFIFLKFNEQLFTEKLAGSKTAKWLETTQTLLQTASTINGNIVKDKDDKIHLHYLFQILLREFTNTCAYSRELLLELFGGVMMLLARAQSTAQFGLQCPSNTEIDKLSQILSFTRMHALNPEKMKIENIASQFNMSANYISIYVKKHSGQSIQQHIIQTKIKTASQLLKNGRHNINEIALKLGFSDASHFNKIYKKYTGTSPKQK
ncbi:AraC family transcriptional regulator [Sphingobacterium faecium]|uniref:AraC family transcriptional regulator n=1 Tax=Sphingobacterium faecium TaxID=34087 RepID=UPI003207FFE3